MKKSGLLTVEYTQVRQIGLGLFTDLVIAKESEEPMFTLKVDIGLAQSNTADLAADLIRSLTVAWRVSEGDSLIAAYAEAVANQNTWSRGEIGPGNQLVSYNPRRTILEPIAPITSIQLHQTAFNLMRKGVHSSVAFLGAYNIKKVIGDAGFMTDCSHQQVIDLINTGEWDYHMPNKLRETGHFIRTRSASAQIAYLAQMEEFLETHNDSERAELAAQALLIHNSIN